MDFFKKIKGGFKSTKKELMEEFKKLSIDMINKFDKINDKLEEEEIINSAIILTGCQSPDDKDKFNVAGSIMGKGKVIVKLLERAILNDNDFKAMVKEALSRVEGDTGGKDDVKDKLREMLNNSNISTSVSAMVMGPDGKLVDVDDNSLPDHVKNALKQMLDKGIGKSGSRMSSLQMDDKNNTDIEDFTDNIEELGDEDY
jgi:hypothetical protein